MLKEGGISIPFFFTKIDDEYQINELGYNLSGIYLGNRRYIIDKSEFDEAFELLNMEFKNLSINKIAISFFENCYQTNDVDLKLINGFIAFESIFNRSKDQLRHTISRHTAILIANSEQEFEEIYNNMKKLYDLRSMLIHVGSISDKKLNMFGSIEEAVELLLNYLRRVFIKSYQFTGSKDLLFSKLNLKGFNNI